MTYFRMRSQGETQVQVGTTGGASVGMPNNGVSIVAATSSETYVLAPPVAGCRKTIICTSSSTTIIPAVKLSTNAAQTITITQLGGNAPAATMFRFAATRSTASVAVVELVGMNSTSWAITNVQPAIALQTGTTYNGMITLSTT